MNKLILNTGVQDFINKNLLSDIMSVLLSKPIFEGIGQKELAEQIEAKKKCREKLPTWFNAPNIYYPNKLNIEQTSSELTAEYKSQLVHGKSLIDLTGGMGVDSYYFARKVLKVFHCEINLGLSTIASHNFKILGQKNITCIPEDGIDFLMRSDHNFDWAYIDPSRRSDKKGKVFLLEDCLPNVPGHLASIFKKTSNILLKTSPLLDIKMGVQALGFVKDIFVVAVQNDVKELLFVLEKGYSGPIQITAANIKPNKIDEFTFSLESEPLTSCNYALPSIYLYEPNAAILKSGGFRSVAQAHGVQKLHVNSHLYSSENLVEFPGRRFKIQQVLPYSKKTLKTLSFSKANITIRNFPISVAEIRKKHKIKEGGDHYLFFTQDLEENLIVLVCSKI